MIFESSLMKQLASLSQKLIQPSLVPIYEENHMGKPDQIGTGFLVSYNNKSILVTAKHVLYGHDYNEDATAKLIFVNNELTHISETGIKDICRASEHDLAVFNAPFYNNSRCLTSFSLHSSRNLNPEFLTIYGFLARDFKREGEELNPSLRIYTNRAVNYESGYMAISYEKHKAKDTYTDQVVMTPIPRGMSGCPMLNSLELLKGNIQVAGVFTDCPAGEGLAYGEHSDKLAYMLNECFG